MPGINLNDGLGSSVAMAGDINGDGISDLVLGADSANWNTGASYVIFGKFRLVWMNNQMMITEGQTVILSNSQLNATSINNPTATVVFTVNNVQGGQFEFVSNPSLPIITFTQQNITNQQVQFVSNRKSTVAYSVSATDGESILPFTQANVTFINHAPKVVNVPKTQIVPVSQSFAFELIANETFIDPGGDTLTYSAQLSDGSMLSNWLNFDTSQPNQLYFHGVAPATIAGTTINLEACDPLNATANMQFQIVTVPLSSNNETAQIAGSVIGGC